MTNQSLNNKTILDDEKIAELELIQRKFES